MEKKYPTSTENEYNNKKLTTSNDRMRTINLMSSAAQRR